MATFNEKIRKVWIRINNFFSLVEPNSVVTAPVESTTVAYPEIDESVPVEEIIDTEDPVNTYTVGEAIDAYISSREGELSPKTVKNYRGIRERYFQPLMGLDVNFIDQAHIQCAIDNEIKEGRSKKSVQNAMMLVRNAMKKAYEDGKLLEDPTIFDVTYPDALIFADGQVVERAVNR